MTNIPEKCTRCGAPISWDEGASVVKCEYCGYKNNLRNDFINLFKNYLSLRDPKKIIKNPISLVFLLPIIFLSILINSPTKKQESIKAEYWPTNWDKFKKFKKRHPDLDKIQKAKTIYFKSDLKDACNYRNSLIKQRNTLELNAEKSLYEFNIRIGNKMQFYDPINMILMIYGMNQ